MWPAFQTAQELFRPSAGNDIAPLTAASVQGTLPHRPQVFGDRGVASVPLFSFGHLLVLSNLVRAVFKDISFMRSVNLEYIQTFNTNPAPIDLQPRFRFSVFG